MSKLARLYKEKGNKELAELVDSFETSVKKQTKLVNEWASRVYECPRCGESQADIEAINFMHENGYCAECEAQNE